MIPDNRELLQALRRQQNELRDSLAELDQRLHRLEESSQGGPAQLPPLPSPPQDSSRLHELPSIPFRPASLPAIPPPFATAPTLALSALPPLPSATTSLELQFGRWLTRIGALFGVITLVLIFSLTHAAIFRLLGPVGMLALSAAVCMGIVIGAERLERRGGGLLVFGRSVLAMGLAGLYVTFYAAHSFDSVRVIQNPILAGLLLLLWSVYVLRLAHRKRSLSLAFFAVALAYFSTAINPVDRFTMAADLLLAGTAVAFLLRHGWASLSYLSLVCTYLALFRRLVIDENGELVLDTGRALPFAPYAIYLIGAWVIFTAAVKMAQEVSFRGGKRIAFLTLNNAAVAILLTLTTYLAGYGYKAMGWTLLWTGVVFIVTAVLAGGRRPDSRFAEVSAAFLAQGIAVLTFGLLGIYTGVTRGVLLALETLILGTATRFSRTIILRVATGVSAFLATAFLVWEIAVHAHHPWTLGLGGAVIMFGGAWTARQHLRPAPLTYQRIVPAAVYYCLLSLALIAAPMVTELSDSALPPALALVAALLTFSVYLFPLYELPPLAQIFLLAAQGLVLFPTETGEAPPRSSTAWVAALTLVLLAWWSRQRIIHYRRWILALNFVYSLALVGLAYHAVRPHVDAQNWMISASLIAGIFLIFGALARVWPLAVMGQLFLAVSLAHFFFPDGQPETFPWTWWAALVPLAVVLATGHAIHAWLREFPEIPLPGRDQLRALAYGYQLLGLAMAVRGILALVPQADQIATFLLLGTVLLGWNATRVHPRALSIRCGLLLDAVGLILLAQQLQLNERSAATPLNAVALLALLAQPALLRRTLPDLITSAERWLLVGLSAAAGWIFVSVWIITRLHPAYLTLSWALYALFLFFLGLATWERRQRWCGLAILAATLVRVICDEIWGISSGWYKVLTFVMLTLITLGLGFIYARFSERLKTWL